MKKAALGSALLVGALLLFVSATKHTDEADQNLYTVVVRHLVEDHRWVDLRYLPSAYPQFREHLPFGFWPFAAADRLFGEWAMRFLAWLLSMGTLGLVAQLTYRKTQSLLGAAAAVLALALCDNFFLYGGLVRLDVPLLLFAAASLSFVLSSDRLSRFIPAAVAAALATLVKGPFGMVLLFAGVVGCLWRERRRSTALAAGTALLAALVPLVAFLWFERTHDSTWWSGYVEAQLLRSATGSRPDGETAFFYPVQLVFFRFWPGLLGVGLAAFAAVKHRSAAARELLLVSAIAVFVLCLPGRKVWNHVLIAYVPLAVAAGIGAAPHLERLWERLGRASLRVSVALVAVALAAMPLLARTMPPPAAACGAFAPLLDALPKGSRVLLVEQNPWHELNAIANHHAKLAPFFHAELGADPEDARAIIADETALPSAPSGFVERAREGPRVLYVRSTSPGG